AFVKHVEPLGNGKEPEGADGRVWRFVTTRGSGGRDAGFGPGAEAPGVGPFRQVMKTGLGAAYAFRPQTGGKQVEQAARFLSLAGGIGKQGFADRCPWQGRPRDQFQPDDGLAQYDPAQLFLENEVEVFQTPGGNGKAQHDPGGGWGMAAFFVMQHQNEIVQRLLPLVQPTA